MILIAIYAPPKLRYKRLSKRINRKYDKNLRMRPLNQSEAESRDNAEIENLEKGGPIAMADYTLINTKGKIFLEKQLRSVVIDLKRNLL
jgi:dephospho-CoA kinase